MARIRSMKPELRTSLVVAEWPREVRYAWTLLWGYLDDHGRGVDNVKLISADLFPLDDDITATVMDEWLQLMANAGYTGDPPLCRYEVGGRRYLHATNWREHQKPSHPTPSRLPPCPHHECEETDGEMVASGSGDAPEALRPEQVRGAGSREQGGGTRETAPPSGDSSTTDDLPPDRCVKHRDLERPPPCGRCKDARRAHERAVARLAGRDDQVLADLRARRDAVPWCGHADCDSTTRWRDVDDTTFRCPECHPDLIVGPLPTSRPLSVVGAR